MVVKKPSLFLDKMIIRTDIFVIFPEDGDKCNTKNEFWMVNFYLKANFRQYQFLKCVKNKMLLRKRHKKERECFCVQINRIGLARMEA